MSPHESTQLAELMSEVRGLRQDMAVIRTKLFGDEDEETDQGRIPRLEARVAAHERKLRRWEPIHLLLRGAWLFMVGAAGYLLNHFLPVPRH